MVGGEFFTGVDETEEDAGVFEEGGTPEVWDDKV